MGVPVMELFLVVNADGTLRKYDKGILAARRTAKDFGKGSTLKPVKVTLTKDGVLEALNAVPFKRRMRVATSPPPARALEVPTVLLGPPPERPVDPLTRPDYYPEYAAQLRGRDPDYIRGWNKTTRALRTGKRVSV